MEILKKIHSDIKSPKNEKSKSFVNCFEDKVHHEEKHRSRRTSVALGIQAKISLNLIAQVKSK